MSDLFILRKGIVTEMISKSEYVVEDVLNKEQLTMIVPWLFRIIHSKIELGEEVYMTLSSSKKKSGTIVSAANLKSGSEFYREKIELDEKHEFVKCKAIVTIAKVKKQLSGSEYLVEDVFDQQDIHMSLTGKQRMNYLRLKIGQEVYVVRSPAVPERGQLALETLFKTDRKGELSKARREIEKWIR